MGKILVVIDMQNDFVTGKLGSPEAKKIVPNVVSKVKEYASDKNKAILFTMDTHSEDYLETEEGKNLPVEHCIKNTDGWRLIPELRDLPVLLTWKDRDVVDDNFFEKKTFGSLALGKFLARFDDIDSVEIVGLCTDVCVIANAVMIKSALPNVPIYVDASCCAGTNSHGHDTAIEAMMGLQIHVLNEGKEPWR